MTADEARERLEAVIWNKPESGQRRLTVAEVDRILAAADAYAEATADARISRMAEDQALGPARLAEAAAEAFERKGEA